MVDHLFPIQLQYQQLKLNTMLCHKLCNMSSTVARLFRNCMETDLTNHWAYHSFVTLKVQSLWEITKKHKTHQTHPEKNSLCQRQYCIKSIHSKQDWWWTQSFWHWNQESEWWKFVQALQGNAHHCVTMTSKLEEGCWNWSHYLDLCVRNDLFIIHLPL